MTEELHTEYIETLGQYLQRCRKERDLSLEDVKDTTKIPSETLEAIESDDYQALPADTFARGFYMLYAKCLELDTDALLLRYDKERGSRPRQEPLQSPTRHEKNINTMASPAMAPALRVILVVLVVGAIIGSLCYYYSFNPIAYIGTQVQDLLHDTSTTENNERTAVMDGAEQHLLTINFLTDTTVTMTIDEGLPEQQQFTGGTTQSWQADTAFSLILPQAAEVELFLNGSRLDVPPPRNGFIRLTLP
ncbi:MAG: helix-turn-helix domain-containing protein [Desulfopila sp.]